MADDSRMQWKEATSANGAKYQIGVLKPEQWGAAEGKEQEDLLGLTKLQEKTGRRHSQIVLEAFTMVPM
jgi:hypothetical protein